jgi:ribosomal protein L7/L12
MTDATLLIIGIVVAVVAIIAVVVLLLRRNSAIRTASAQTSSSTSNTATKQVLSAEQAARSLTAAQRDELKKLVDQGYTVSAIREVRSWTGVGLNEAKEVLQLLKLVEVES